MARGRFGIVWFFVLAGLLAAVVAVQVASMPGQALHADPQAIRSAKNSNPAPQWSTAVAKAQRAIREGMVAQNLPGVSVAVGVEGNMVWAEGFGWADVPTHSPVTPDTRFRIGTASTVLSSAAAGLLLEQGKFQLDDEIQRYVPQFPKKSRPVTLRQLMAHTAGLGTDNGDDSPLFRQRCEQPVEALPAFAGNGLLFEPGTQYRHSRYGWIVVSAAIEAAAKEPFLDYMREQVFEPLGMEDTGAESTTEENPEHIGEEGEDAPIFTFVREVILQPLGYGGAPTKWDPSHPASVYFPGFPAGPFARYRLHETRPHNVSCYAGAMAFFSTPSDLVRFGNALNRGKLLQPATVQTLQSPQELASGDHAGYGLGWDLEAVTLAGKPTEAAGRDGELLGRRVATFVTFPDAGIVVAVTANRWEAETHDLALQIAEAFAQSVRK